jgi:ribulose-bisphosphate carboxylase large chain
MHTTLIRNEKNGIYFFFLANIMRIAGIDNRHIGSVIRKLEGRKEELLATKELITQEEVDEIKNLRLHQKWYNIKPILPVASGWFHPGILPELFYIYGMTNIVIQVGGVIYGHPIGIEAGDRAVVQAIEEYKQVISLEECTEKHKELEVFLETWCKEKPR